MPLSLRRPTPFALRLQRRRQLMLSTDEVAAMCRTAYLAFINGETWGKRELAHWLLQHYRPIARAADDVPVSGTIARPRPESIHPIRLRAFLDDTRATLLEDLLGARSETNRIALQEQALDAGLVAPETDVAGRTCYVPVDLPDIRLIDRLRALLVADGLATGAELAHVIVCNVCNVVAFDLDTPPRWSCKACRHESVLRMRSDFAGPAPLDQHAWFEAG